MGNRLSKIYTRTGDEGTTGLGTGERVAKDDLRVAAYGRVDELNSHIGLLRAQLVHAGHDRFESMLSKIQHELFNLGGELCMPDTELMVNDAVVRLEAEMDFFNNSLPSLKDFILPAGSLPCAQAHVTRTVCRHAERDIVSLHNRDQNITAIARKYINRLSDWLFIFARVVSRLDGGQEVLWQKDAADSI